MKVPYAGVRHFGWPAHNIEPLEFLYEALGQTEAGIVVDYEVGMAALIREAGLR